MSGKKRDDYVGDMSWVDLPSIQRAEEKKNVDKGLVNLIKNVVQVAGLQKIKYDQHIKDGFTEEQAFELAKVLFPYNRS